MTKERNKKNRRRAVSADVLPLSSRNYRRLVSDISDLMEQARRTAARSVNSILTATYWEVGRRIVEYEQEGASRAEYGKALLKRMSQDLTHRFGRGFSKRNLEQMRAFYLGWEIAQTPSAKFEDRAVSPTLSGEPGKSLSATLRARQAEKSQTLSAQSLLMLTSVHPMNQTPLALTDVFPLSWSHYVRDPGAVEARKDRCIVSQASEATRPLAKETSSFLCNMEAGRSRGCRIQVDRYKRSETAGLAGVCVP